MSIEFSLNAHALRPGVRVLQILRDGLLVATLVPDETGNGVRLISKHIAHAGRPVDTGDGVILIEVGFT